ncbi:MAG TPA: DUF5715 family protein [Pyrinomonadaceae bacterium]|jgi:hypothetical protein
MEERKIRREFVPFLLIAAAVAVALLILPGLKRRARHGLSILIPLSATAEAAEINAWKQAVMKVKEERGEPTGKQAQVSVPPELAHYSDTRRFLAIQVAEWREHRFETPTDFIGLSGLLKKGELVTLRPVTENYILLGVGGTADTEPFTSYDKATGQRLSLYGAAELEREYAHIADSLSSLEGEATALKEELGRTNKRERARRSKLAAQLARKEKELKAQEERKELLDLAYGEPERRQKLLADYEALESFAKDFSGRSYDLTDASARRELKVRMLSALRPEALKVMEEIAASYKQKFDRPLPITSLVRPEEYQHMLSKVNPNATLIATPPHSTGLAFDIYYRFMTAEEQSHVMAHLAQLEDEGRIEVLRENRDHYHVFAFIDGKRPEESFVQESLARTAPEKTVKNEDESERPARKEERRKEKRQSEKKATAKSTAKKSHTAKAHPARGKRR